MTLSRTTTIPSIHSWWSDSNPTGATLNLHAAAKPLMRFMYERQALKLIHTKGTEELTQTMFVEYLSYLIVPYLSDFTKSRIFGEIWAKISTAKSHLSMCNPIKLDI
ncbi:hypothetical protein MIND_00650500 [Mycena indigotica]|uniref:Uncharacterized protein n=1 Tax=Mycena indigotica TaxID=2126181 RepID=A0A8H6W3E9_9AGAR|nr:uncharacterized protein MIND_00650500 [Mycena indigotica]KAF7304184.1 hypothetical protein MIND_00650500 [Mycena indigotica]